MNKKDMMFLAVINKVESVIIEGEVREIPDFDEIYFAAKYLKKEIRALRDAGPLAIDQMMKIVDLASHLSGMVTGSHDGLVVGVLENGIATLKNIEDTVSGDTRLAVVDFSSDEETKETNEVVYN